MIFITLACAKTFSSLNNWNVSLYGGYGKWANIKRYTNYRFICICQKQQNGTTQNNDEQQRQIHAQTHARTDWESEQICEEQQTLELTHVKYSWGLIYKRTFEWVFKYRGFCQRNWMFSQQIYDKMFIISALFHPWIWSLSLFLCLTLSLTLRVHGFLELSLTSGANKLFVWFVIYQNLPS